MPGRYTADAVLDIVSIYLRRVLYSLAMEER